ncbi:MAG: hypothetical protein IJL66_01245 [Lachnospiraceae bacterium]|nr:hypothetical protein [Lachnospiraceae bacterium]
MNPANSTETAPPEAVTPNGKLTESQLSFDLTATYSLGGFDPSRGAFPIDYITVYVSYRWADNEPQDSLRDAIAVTWNGELLALRDGEESFSAASYSKGEDGAADVTEEKTAPDASTENSVAWAFDLGPQGEKHYGYGRIVLVPREPMYYSEKATASSLRLAFSEKYFHWYRSVRPEFHLREAELVPYVTSQSKMDVMSYNVLLDRQMR